MGTLSMSLGIPQHGKEVNFGKKELKKYSEFIRDFLSTLKLKFSKILT